MMYFLGRGVSADPAEAYKWILLASRHGGSDALNIRRKIEARISAHDMAEGEKRAANVKVDESKRNPRAPQP